MQPIRWMTLLFSGLLCAPLLAQGPATQKTWEFHGGRWPEVMTTAPSTHPTVDPSLVRVEELVRQGHYSDARKRLVAWFKDNKGSPSFDRALYLMAEALYGYGDRIRSFYYLDELMDEYADSPLYYRALEKQYQIADDFLNGYKSRFLGIAFLGREDEAIEMLFRIQQRSPGSPLAETALLRTANWYYGNRDYDLAADAYGAYIHSYPRSAEVPQARLRQAFANLAQSRGFRFDATPALDARVELLDLQQIDPQTASEANVSNILEQIDEHFAKKIYNNADYYRRTHEPVAAVYLYRYVIRAYPNSPEAQLARQDLERMPSLSLQSPPPGRSIFGVPSTQPLSSAAD